MRRRLYGGVRRGLYDAYPDMGAYEYYINDIAPGPGPGQMTLTWSSHPSKTYTVFYSDGLLTWRVGDANACSPYDPETMDEFPLTTSWTDDGSKTSVPPSLAPRRFYRILENP